MATVRDYAELLQAFRIAILTTRGSDGHYRSRPMAMPHRFIEDDFWFATSTQSRKYIDLSYDPRCSLTLYDPLGGGYVSVSGTAELVDEPDAVRRRWDEAWEPWLPGGPGRRDAVLIRLVPEHVEYQHPDGQRPQVLLSTDILPVAGEERTEEMQLDDVSGLGPG